MMLSIIFIFGERGDWNFHKQDSGVSKESQQARALNQAATALWQPLKQEPDAALLRAAVRGRTPLSFQLSFTIPELGTSLTGIFSKNGLTPPGLDTQLCYRAHAGTHTSSKTSPGPLFQEASPPGPPRAVCLHPADLRARRTVGGAAPRRPTEQTSTKETALRVRMSGTQKHCVHPSAVSEHYDYC